MTETRRPIVDDLAHHLDCELTKVLKRHVHVLALTTTVNEARMIITSGVGSFMQCALMAAATVSGVDKMEAAYEELLAIVLRQATENRDLLVSTARQTIAPGT